MALKSKHIIRKLFVDVLYHSTADGLQLQKEVTDWCRNHLLPQLEAMLEGMWQEEELVKISALEIELAMDEGQEWQQPALKKLELQLNDKLQYQLQGADQLVTRTLTRSFEEQFVFFLLKGYLPWWTTVESRHQFLALLQQWSQSESGSSTLIAAALQLNDARRRLLYLLPDHLYFELLTTVYEDQVRMALPIIGHTRQFLEELPVTERKELSDEVKQLLLQMLAADAAVVHKTFIADLLRLLLRRQQVILSGSTIRVTSPVLQEAIMRLLRAMQMQHRWVIKEQPAVSKSVLELHTNLRNDNTSAVVLTATGDPLLSREPVDVAAATVKKATDKKKDDVQKASHKETEEHGKEFIEVNEEPQHSVTQPGKAITEAQGISAKPPAQGADGNVENAAPENPSPESQTRAAAKRDDSVAVPGSSESETPGEAATEQLAPAAKFKDAAVTPSNAGFASSGEMEDAAPGPLGIAPAKEREIRQDLLRAVSGITEDESAIYIANSGLILLAPFLPVFFQRMGLLDKDSITDYPEAVLLLHYLATGRTTAAEYEAVLPKILCGLEPEVPLNLQYAWQDDWTAECTDLLLSVIEYWSILKDTSPDGLREAFLQRNGKLTKSERGWLLQVEQQAYDMLLQQLPWNISMIRLGWMKMMIRTEWT